MSDNEPVQFTRGAAVRISNAVRKVEIGERSGGQLTFDRVSPNPTSAISPVVFRVCTFTGAWNKLAAKVVTFQYQTTTPNTVSATNLFAAIAAAASPRNCAIAKDGTAWYLIAAECS